MLQHSEVTAGYYCSLKDVTHVALLGTTSVWLMFRTILFPRDGHMQCMLSEVCLEVCPCVLVLILMVPWQRLH